MTRNELAALACVALLATATGACDKARKTPDAAPPAVTVRRPDREPVIEYVQATGTAAASQSVDLVARVTGYLRSIHFEDGVRVQAGQLLMVIEPEPYEQQVRLNEAALLMAQAEYDRQVEMAKQNATAAANVEKWRCQRDQAAAQVELARLNLSYTRITAPFSGRIGRRLADPGNLVGPGAAVKLATLDQLTPIYVYFSLGERDVLRLRDRLRQEGITPQAAVGKTPVFVGLQDEEDYPHEGVMDFVDSAISPATGTLLMRAKLKNEDARLFPGVFARVRIPLSEPRPMLVTPQSAIGNDQQGDYVLVADADNVVVRRSVVKGPLTPRGCAIRSGLKPEDRVIVKGMLKARPGEKVAPAADTEPAPPRPSR